MTFFDNFFPRTSSDINDVFCPSTNLIIVGIDLKHYFTFRSKKIIEFKLNKVTSDTDVPVICDSLK